MSRRRTDDGAPALAARFDFALSDPPIALPHVWEWLIGSDHAPMALRADWQTQLERCRRELGVRYVRFHGLLSDDMSTLLRGTHAPCFSFFNVDRIFDHLLSIGMKPFVELSFMPMALASGGDTVFHYRGNVTPPYDYTQWQTLIRALASHLVQRYGIDEVATWYFEVWNEPNLAKFWKGTCDDYLRLYAHAALALKSVHGAIRVGGPATAANAWIAELIEHCETQRLPLDFISTHHYPNDRGDENDTPDVQLAQAKRGALREATASARAVSANRPLFYTEWNSSACFGDPLHDEAYAAAFIVKTALEASAFADAYAFWTFSDLFEEEGQQSRPFHGGFGLLGIHGIAKPSYRAFQRLHRMGGESYPVQGAHATVDAWLVRSDEEIVLVLSNHALPHHAIETEQVHVRIAGAPIPLSASIARIDADHCNPKAQWQALGSPEYPDATTLAALDAASCIEERPHASRHDAGGIMLEVALPVHAVAFVTLRFASPQSREQAAG